MDAGVFLSFTTDILVIKSKSDSNPGEKMKSIRNLLIVVAIFLGMEFSLQTVQAAGWGGPNTGDYVYENREYITNSQYDQLEAINNKIDQDVSPQRLYILITDDEDNLNYLADVGQANLTSKRKDTTILGKTEQVLYGESHYYDMLLDESGTGEDMDLTNNYLVMDLKHNKVYLNPSLQASLYLTDLVLWKAEWGLSSQLKSNNVDTQISALFQLANNLEPKLVNVSATSKMLKSKDIYDVRTTLNYIGMAIVLIVVIIILIIIHNINKNKPHHGGGGSELGNSDYDAGFDEGYYMGSNDPFM